MRNAAIGESGCGHVTFLRLPRPHPENTLIHVAKHRIQARFPEWGVGEGTRSSGAFPQTRWHPASRPHFLSGEILCLRPATSWKSHWKSKNTPDKATTACCPVCLFSRFPSCAAFGESHFFLKICFEDHSTFRESSRGAEGWLSAAGFDARQPFSCPAAANGSGHCPVKKAASPT